LLFAELTVRREHIAPAARPALLTGMRRGETLSPRWEHVNLTGRVQTFVVLGHSSPTMTGDYTHTSPQAMEKAMGLVAEPFPREDIFAHGKITAGGPSALTQPAAAAGTNVA